LTEDGYWHFPGEAYDAGHIIEQYVRAQQAGMNIALPTLRPIELMVQHQRPDGLFDLGSTNYIGAQAHGVRALGVTLPLLEARAAAEATSEPVETSIARPVQAPPPHLTTLTLCLEVSEDGRCTSPQIEFQPDVTIYYVLTYENLSPSDEIVERWYLGQEEWTEAALNTDYVIKQGGASGRFASSGIRLTASEWERLGSASTGQLELWLNGELALTIEFTVTSPAAGIGPLVIALADPSTDSGAALLVDIEPIYTIHVQK
jgi:hypothetical protein